MCVKNSTRSKIWHDMSNSLAYDAAGPACNQAASWTSYELRAGILNNWELASCENLTKNVKFLWRELPSVESHTYKFSRASWNILKIWNCMSNFEIHFENLTQAKELWYNRVRKKNKARSKFDRKSQIFRPQFLREVNVRSRAYDRYYTFASFYVFTWYKIIRLQS